MKLFWMTTSVHNILVFLKWFKIQSVHLIPYNFHKNHKKSIIAQKWSFDLFSSISLYFHQYIHLYPEYSIIFLLILIKLLSVHFSADQHSDVVPHFPSKLEYRSWKDGYHLVAYKFDGKSRYSILKNISTRLGLTLVRLFAEKEKQFLFGVVSRSDQEIPPDGQ